jgi:hypothetical protein
MARHVIDQLGEDVLGRAVDDKPGLRSAAGYLLAYPQVATGT